MIELLNPSLPGAARAVAGIAAFRLRVAATPAARKPELVARRFMTPARRNTEASAQRLLADLRRFAPEGFAKLGAPAELALRLNRLLQGMQRETLTLHNDRVLLYRWQPERQPGREPERIGRAQPRHALLSHGWESDALSFALVIERLLARGYTVHALDHVAHGASSGVHSGLPRFAEVLRDVAGHLHAQGVSIDLGVGHSLGAGAWLMAATRLGVSAGRLVLLAPFIDTPELLGKWLTLHGLPAGMRPAMQEAMMALHGPGPLQFGDMAIGTLASRLRPPTVVVQDPKDFVAPMRHSRELARHCDRVRCVAAPHSGHVGVLFAPETLQALEGG
jgi:pimeloyl-ACP methyl ester carboxylesterase